jgi:ABC-type Zn uptake system ZnuABC Zn-binding protein ZnuA
MRPPGIPSAVAALRRSRLGGPGTRWRPASATVLVALLTVAVGGPAGSLAQSAGPIRPQRVVATSSVLADLAAQVAGDRATVTSLVPRGAEVHTFDPSPEDAAAVAEADLVVMNGLGLDDWLRGLVDSAGAAHVPVIALAEGLDDTTYLAGVGSEAGDPAGEGPDPHLWLDVANARRYVERLRDLLAALDPGGAPDYAAAAAAFDARLAALDAEIRSAMAGIPNERRRVVSLHDAFAYFGEAYGLEIVAAVMPNPGQEPSAADLAALVDRLRADGASAILAESQFPDDLAAVIAAEAGVAIVEGLFTDSLGDSPADTYEGMMRSNLDRIVEALR